MKNRNTRQREIILKVIKNNRNHPTIAEIYHLVSQIDSTVGQATVYRNIKKFIDDGSIYVVKTKSGIDRYDYYNEHAHFECLKCGKVIDLFDDQLFEELKEKLLFSNGNIINYNLSLDGYCNECNEKITKNI